MSCLYCQSPTLAQEAFCCQACSILYGGHFFEIAQKARENKKNKWLSLDAENFQRIYNLSPHQDQSVYRFYVEGLQCSSCIHLLEKMPEFDSNILSAQVFWGSSELIVKTSPLLPLSGVLQLIEEMGYAAHPLKKEDLIHDRKLSEDKRWLRQIAVAGACTGNIMMFTIPVYSGVDGVYQYWFLRLSFFIFLPIVFYSAQAFYPGAWRALKTRHLNLDFSLTIALWGSFLFSTVNLLRGSGHVYYDSTASFIFLILSSRYLVRKAQFKTVDSLQKKDDLWDNSYLLKTETGWKPIPVKDIAAGAVLQLHRGQLLPADAEQLVDNAQWDSSWMTGEVWPRLFSPGMKVQGGYRLVSESTEIRTTAIPSESEISKMLTALAKESLSKSLFMQKMDIFSQRLLLSVFLIGFTFFVFYSSIDVEEAFQRTLALWVIACPCALAFAAPLALHRALLKARKAGLLIKSVDVFEKTKNIKELIFDKTGTLTTGHLRLVKTEPAIISQEIKDLVLGLEKSSHHPVAFAFRSAWPENSGGSLFLTDIHEKSGEKIYGLFDGSVYSLRGTTQPGPYLSIELVKKDQRIAHFYFSDEVHIDTEKYTAQLQKNYKLMLLSGDRQDRVESLARQLAIPVDQAHGSHSPLQKWDFIKKHPHSLMMGDGANDAAALKEAFIGVAAQGSMPLSFQAADIYLLQPGLKPISDFLAISQETQRVLRRNFTIALTYNFAAGLCALCGWVNPLVAAILMPLSSATLLLSTLKEKV